MYKTIVNTKNKLNKTIKKINSNFHEIYLLYAILGLSISIFLKDFNLFFFKFINFEFIYIYRILLVAFTFYLLIISEKKINLKIFYLIGLNLIFLFNVFFGEKLILNMNINEFLSSVNIKTDVYDNFSKDKTKVVLINTLNILFPVITIMIIKFRINFILFEKIAYKINEIYLLILFSYLVLKIFLLYDVAVGIFSIVGPSSNFNQHFINSHGMIYILNIFFIQLFYKIYNKDNLFKNLTYTFLIIICFYISGSTLFFLICFVMLIISFIIFRIKIPYYLLFSFILLFILYIFLAYFSDGMSPEIHGSILNSIFVRFSYIKLFILNSDNLNLLIGNDIFVDNIYTYPHNFAVDIIVCSGVLGIIFFIFLLFEIFKKINFNYKNLSNFIFLIFFQSLIFSIFSGFFFNNTTLNILLATTINLLALKEEKIK